MTTYILKKKAENDIESSKKWLKENIKEARNNLLLCY